MKTDRQIAQCQRSTIHKKKHIRDRPSPSIYLKPTGTFNESKTIPPSCFIEHILVFFLNPPNEFKRGAKNKNIMRYCTPKMINEMNKYNGYESYYWSMLMKHNHRNMQLGRTQFYFYFLTHSYESYPRSRLAI